MTPFAKAASLLLGLLGTAILGGCQDARPDLAEVLAHARGHIVDEKGQDESVEEILAAARNRPVSVSFAYVGCGGGRPRMERLAQAAKAVSDAADTLHVVLDIVDEPNRFPDVVRDVAGTDEANLDRNTLRFAFVRKPDLWPKDNGPAVDGIMEAVGLRYGRERHIETVTGIGMFDRTGRFVGIRY